MKLEAIILAAGAGSRMVELTRVRPKCLLPVGNQNLIWYSITGLRLIGINRIIILVPDIHEADIKQYCHKEFKNHKELVLDFVVVSTKSDSGTAESIMSIKDKIRGDFIVHSCDTVIDPKVLSLLLNHYRLYDPLLTMVLSNDPDYFQSRNVPGRREKECYMRDVIALEPLDKLDLTSSIEYSANKVVFLHSERDLKHKLKIKNKELALHPSLEVYSRFLDSHIYIFKRAVLDLMEQNRDKAVLKGEMIPLLISKQFSVLHKEIIEEDEEMQSQIHQSNYELELKDRLEAFNPSNASRTAYLQKSSASRPSACHALVVKDLKVFRVNTIGTYLDCNKESRAILSMFGLKNRNLIKDCAIGDNSTIGEKCQLKKGSVGSNCKIGDKVKLIDCVIMDNVEIESNSTLTGCIIGNGSKIGAKCDLKSCIVGFRQIVSNGRKASGEVLIDDGYVIDLSDPMIDRPEK